MKKIIVLMALLVSHAAQSEPLGLEEYSASVVGSIELLTNNGEQVELKSGAAKVKVDDVSIFKSPIEYTMGGRKLTIIQENNEFDFLVPYKNSEKSRSILVHRKYAKQLAHLGIEETKEFIKSYEETGPRRCSYQEMSYECSGDAQGKTSCGNRLVSRSGSQKARYLVSEYNRTLKLMIAFASKKVLVQTEAQPVPEYKLLEELSSCR